jgi:hypothetical protein
MEESRASSHGNLPFSFFIFKVSFEKGIKSLIKSMEYFLLIFANMCKLVSPRLF